MPEPRRILGIYRDPLAIPTTYQIWYRDGGRQDITEEQYKRLWNHETTEDADG